MVGDRQVEAKANSNREALLDAAERILVEEGYGAMTSRRVAAKAKLKSQLVHYYFKTMDDLAVVLIRRIIDEYLDQQIKILGSKNPIQKLMELSYDRHRAVLNTEFLALANHKECIRAEFARFNKIYRNTQAKIIGILYEERGLSGELLPQPIVLASLIEAVSRTTAMEAHLRIGQGRQETIEYVEKLIHYIESAEVRT
jgi:TetR/AcrR family transcriptional regulator